MEPWGNPARSGAGIISRIRLENFMCHSSLEIELGGWVNFITGQNGSGKSAILTALCVAFGCRAKGTQRASSLKDFIKNGCNYASVVVEIKNQGEDAFKPETYGNIIILERRILESTSSTTLKDCQGRKVATRRDELRELVEHFNIDVENPCVIMSQDKSREFLHSGNDKDKFKFFFKATLLQRVNELLLSIGGQLDAANAILDELESTIRPIVNELKELDEKIKNMEQKLAWCWVYDVDKQIQEQNVKLEKLKERVPTCQDKIDKDSAKVEELKELLLTKKTKITSMMEKTSEVRRMKEELQQKLSLATKESLELEEEHAWGSNVIQKMSGQIMSLERQVQDIQQQHMKATQAEVSEIEERMKKINDEVDIAQKSITRFQEEESSLSENLAFAKTTVKEIAKETLVNGDIWALAIDCAIGRLLDAFIVTNHKDSLLLRACAKEANYQNLQILIYDFSRPRLNIPNYLLPSTNHPTTLSVIHSDNPTILNVLVDMGHAERQVLVQDYEIGKSVAFDQRIQNLKEVYTSDGYRMFYRGSVQTTLPPHKRARTGRLCSSIDDQLHGIEMEASKVQEVIQEGRGRKRGSERSVEDLEVRLHSAKKRRTNEERVLMAKQLALRDMKNAYDAEYNNADHTPNVEELYQEILDLQEQIQGKQMSLEKIKIRMTIAQEKASNLRSSFENLCDSAKGEIDAIEEAERELLLAEDDLRSAEDERSHYERIMNNKVLPDIKKAEELLEELQHNRQENFRKASIICPESEVEGLGGCVGSTPEQLSAQLNRLKQKLQHESQRYSESIDDLRAMYKKKQSRILEKQHNYEAFRGKIIACKSALDLRWKKFRNNLKLLRRELTWKFNGHLTRKGISGNINVDYEEKTLSVEVKMPQDASGNTVRDTRGLSGGERSFSTLCFALSLHGMTEAPFRAMDEFDVFMDAVSRKISLDTLVDFAVGQGSQWIFITPHDISMVKPDERVRKQQMAAPRS
ncbi:hypothetical protein J5N97_029801 [Dioscorea zingiberensis]|uniref:RecF/RecN/SMC N-terminal domain-containing protein n=1 Tax=Dioscorea zingiberensis TaxID=325984 RepID=A0A9D5BWJ1_9LILI|nr:hypothetical protein J5N97_029801 [Dioscorea zingiberensis]